MQLQIFAKRFMSTLKIRVPMNLNRSGDEFGSTHRHNTASKLTPVAENINIAFIGNMMIKRHKESAHKNHYY